MQDVLHIEGLPDAALDAAAEFHRTHLPMIRARLAANPESLVLIFSRSEDDHRGWRLSAVQQIAREAAPGRVNAIAGGDDAGLAAALQWIAHSPGITGQLFALSGNPGQELP